MRTSVLWRAVVGALLAGAGGAQVLPGPLAALALRAEANTRAVTGFADSSGAAALPAATVQGVLVEMGTRAGVIFAGRVLAVERQDAAGYVDVRFKVETAVRGCAGKGVYVLREWAGLWTGQTERYRVGERRLMLLTARGPSGMSAPVDGMLGAIPLLARAMPPVMDEQGRVAADTAQGVSERAADLRWVQARALRRMARPGSAPEGAWVGPPVAMDAAGGLGQGTGLSTVLGWLDGAR